MCEVFDKNDECITCGMPMGADQPQRDRKYTTEVLNDMIKETRRYWVLGETPSKGRDYYIKHFNGIPMFVTNEPFNWKQFGKGALIALGTAIFSFMVGPYII